MNFLRVKPSFQTDVCDDDEKPKLKGTYYRWSLHAFKYLSHLFTKRGRSAFTLKANFLIDF